MDDRHTRRKVLTTGVAACLTGISGCSALGGNRATTRSSEREDARGSEASLSERQSDGREDDPVVDVRGAIYLPAQAFNFYQQWAQYDPEVIERDLGYATEVNLNAIRTWACYELWEEDAEAHGRALEHFLSTADEHGLRVVLSLFDFAGQEPTEERLTNTDPRTATGVRSPGAKVMKRRARWDEPKEFVRWIMDRYRDDDRLLAIEAMNEPGWSPDAKTFAHAMFRTMADERGTVPLTVGSTSMANNSEYVDWGSDILQFHYNFAENRAVYRDMLRSNEVIADELDVPVWLSEWQRVRDATGFGAEPPDDQKEPEYASLAPLIQEAGFGNFFWSLMVKPAYVPVQRKHGILNGLFHEDGAVWSADDARAIKAMSGEPSFDGRERREWPEWASELADETTG